MGAVLGSGCRDLGTVSDGESGKVSDWESGKVSGEAEDGDVFRSEMASEMAEVQWKSMAKLLVETHTLIAIFT